MNLYVDNYESKLSIKGNRLVVTEAGASKEFPLDSIDNLALNKNVQITSQAICKLCEAGISISWFSASQFICQANGYGTESVMKVKNQFALLDKAALRLKLSKQNIKAKIVNQLEYVNKMKAFKESDIEKAKTEEELMGVEGAYASLYFSELKNKFNEKYGFVKRIKHPCTDPVNSVLSFVYSMLYREFSSLISLHGMNPSVGFFHKLRNGHCALSSDLMESLRCELCDKTAVKVLDSDINDDDFEFNTDGSVYISKRLRSMIISEFHKKLSERIFTLNGFSNDFKGLLNQMIYSYENALQNEKPECFTPFIRGDYYA
ncbi:CRISPR-associated endonuclease Cas1 [Ruminococcus sp. HUN007]|uniref:CRISPR-associated endonuclease Cas1 n=1 Tax=Ruminococcus sp. HUN007 TaxID=1514668 RepID=UPI0005D28CF4|nr:CRISPR-associated endonuclease Cas1 [Ruminococcus sp. HUN007]